MNSHVKRRKGIFENAESDIAGENFFDNDL